MFYSQRLCTTRSCSSLCLKPSLSWISRGCLHCWYNCSPLENLFPLGIWLDYEFYYQTCSVLPNHLCEVRSVENFPDNDDDDDDLTVIVTLAKWKISKVDEQIQINSFCIFIVWREREKPNHINLLAFILININCLKV